MMCGTGWSGLLGRLWRERGERVVELRDVELHTAEPRVARAANAEPPPPARRVDVVRVGTLETGRGGR